MKRSSQTMKLSGDEVSRPGFRNTLRLHEALGLPAELRERYAVESLLGTGSASSVYLARERTTGKRVAIKFLRQPACPELAERFLREGRLLASIDHPNVLKVHEVLPSESCPCLVVEYMPGGSLRDRLRDGEKMPLRQALVLMRQVLRGLEALHQRGILHRDIKPDNLLLDDKGRVRIADLGLAKDIADESELTQGGQIMGSPDYMSPEMIRGGRPSIGTDLYSAGCVFYEMLTGRPPFQAEQLPELLRLHLRAAPAPIEHIRPDLPEAVARMIGRMLSKDAGQRPASAAEGSLLLARAAPYSLRVTVGTSRSGACEAIRALTPATILIPRLPHALLAAVLMGLLSLPILAHGLK